ncbi:MAG TPA: SpoIIIAH-like family protein [bacterium]|jgi:stage III sporulation protein AH|nr:SpoIIIAH-like family protein [bacterium]
MRWRERKAGIWLVICVIVLIGSAFYLQGQQLGQKRESADLINQKEGPSIPAVVQYEEQPQGIQDHDFYVEQRLERERTRSKEMEVLTEIVDNPNSDCMNREQAQNRLIYLGEKLVAEAELEGLIKAKGFADSIVYLQPDSVHVLVKAKDLSADEVARIGDIVTKGWQIPLEKVIIDARL